jgi:hypothetical protein
VWVIASVAPFELLQYLHLAGFVIATVLSTWRNARKIFAFQNALNSSTYKQQSG